MKQTLLPRGNPISSNSSGERVLYKFLSASLILSVGSAFKKDDQPAETFIVALTLLPVITLHIEIGTVNGTAIST